MDQPIKPCPWCHSSDVNTKTYSTNFPSDRIDHWVSCNNCGLGSPIMPAPAETIAAWERLSLSEQPSPQTTTTPGVTNPRARRIALLEQGMAINKQTTECMEDMLDELWYGEGEHPETIEAANEMLNRLDIWEVELIREIELLKREQQS